MKTWQHHLACAARRVFLENHAANLWRFAYERFRAVAAEADPSASRLEPMEPRILMAADPLQLEDYAVFAGDDVSIHRNARIAGGLVGSEEDVFVGDNARLEGAFGGDDFRAGRNVRVAGSVAFDDDVQLGRNARVSGGVTAGDELISDRNARIDGAVLTQASDPWADLSAPTPLLPDGPAGDDLRVRQRDGEVFLPAGDHGRLTLDRNARIRLGAGAHAFTSVQLGDNARLRVDALGEGEQLRVRVAGDLLTGRNARAEARSADTAGVRWDVGGRVSLGDNARWRGRVVAGDRLDVGRNGRVEGVLISGGRLHLGQNARVTHVAFAPDPTGPADATPPSVTLSLTNDTGTDAADRVTADAAVALTAVDDRALASLTLAITADGESAAPSSVLDRLDASGGLLLFTGDLAGLLGGPLPDGPLTLTLAATDAAGNATTATLELVLDRAAAAPVLLPLRAADDTGASPDDGLTRVARPLLRGTAEPGSTVTVRAGDRTLGTATADAGGAWSLTPAEDLPDGEVALTATAVDPAGNASAASDTLVLTVDTAAPAAPAIRLAAADRLDDEPATTDREAVALDVTAEPGSTVFLAVGDGSDAALEAVADATGTARFDAVPLTLGTNALSATAADPAGNLSAEGTLALTRVAPDTAAPRTVAALALDTGRSAEDGLTRDPSLVLEATDDTDLATATLTLVGSTAAAASLRSQLDAEGRLTLDAAAIESLFGPLPDGELTFRLDATDTRGNASSAEASFRLDRTAPAAPTIELAEEFRSSSPRETVSEVVTLVASAEPGSSVTILVPGHSASEAIATEAGEATFADIRLPLGETTVTVSVSDAAGNQSAAAVAAFQRVLPDAEPPAAELSLLTDTGVSDADGITAEVSVSVEASDASGLAEVRLELSRADDPTDRPARWVDLLEAGAPASALSLELTQERLQSLFGDEALAEGELVFRLSATDSAGNVGSSEPVRVTLDAAAAETPDDDGFLAAVVDAGALRSGDNSFEIAFDRDLQGDARSEPAAYRLVYLGELGASAEEVAVASAEYDENGRRVRLTPEAALSPGGYALTFGEDLLDGRGNPAAVSTLGFRVERPLGVQQISPSEGEERVNLQREVRVAFDQPVDLLGSGAVVVSGPNGAVATRTLLTPDGTTALVCPEAGWPAASLLRVTVDLEQIRPRDAIAGETLAQRTGRDRAEAGFRTLSQDGLATTRVSGRVRDSITLEPLAGVGLRLLSSDASTVTASDGSFTLEGVPAPKFYVSIEGAAATSSSGSGYASLVKPFDAVPGVETAIGDGRGPFDIYLPRVTEGSLTPLSSEDTTRVRLSPDSIDDLRATMPSVTDAQWAAVSVGIEPGAAVDDFGTPVSDAFVVPVNPDFLPAPLPAHLNPSLVVSVQAPGATNFNVPASIRFPNLDGLEPGSKTYLFSFNHDAGRFEVNGTATVSEDGLTVETDPGVGITAPGWHFNLPGSQAGPGLPDPAAPPPYDGPPTEPDPVDGSPPLINPLGGNETGSNPANPGGLDEGGDTPMVETPEVGPSEQVFRISTSKSQRNILDQKNPPKFGEFASNEGIGSPGFLHYVRERGLGGENQKQLDLARVASYLGTNASPEALAAYRVLDDLLYRPAVSAEGPPFTMGEKDLYDYSEEELVSTMRSIFKLLRVEKESTAAVFNQFLSGSGAPLVWDQSTALSEFAARSPDAKRLQADISSALKAQLSSIARKGSLDVAAVNLADAAASGRTRKFGLTNFEQGNLAAIGSAATSAITGNTEANTLKAIIGGTQGVQVILNDIEFDEPTTALNGQLAVSYRGTFTVVVQDRFGAGYNDLYRQELAAMYILQHSAAHPASAFENRIFLPETPFANLLLLPPQFTSVSIDGAAAPGAAPLTAPAGLQAASFAAAASAAEPVNEPATFYPVSRQPGFGSDPTVFYRYTTQSGVEIAGDSRAGGFADAVLPAEEPFTLEVYQPSTNRSVTRSGISSPSGNATTFFRSNLGLDAPTEQLEFTNFGGLDTDGDGIPDVGERVLGLNAGAGDSNGNGVSDASALARPDGLGEAIALPTGVISRVSFTGPATSLTDISSGGRSTLLVASDAGTLSSVDVAVRTAPTVLDSVATAGRVLDVASDQQTDTAIALLASGSVELYDVSEPADFRTLGVVEEGARAVAAADGVAYLVSARGIGVLDLASASIGETIAAPASVGSSTSASAVVLGDRLAVYLSGPDRLLIFDVSDRRSPVLTDDLSVSIASRAVGISGSGSRIYLAGSGIRTIDASVPGEARALGSATPFFAARQFAYGGASLGVLAAEGEGLGVFRVFEDEAAPVLQTQYDVGGDATDVLLRDGTAWVAGGAGGLTAVEYLPTDLAGEAPTVSLDVLGLDVDPETPGIQVSENTRLPLFVEATDDVAVASVEFYRNGVLQQSASRTPFQADVAAGDSTDDADLVLGVVAVDTSGNRSTLTSVDVQVVADGRPPTLLRVSPDEGATLGARDITVALLFDEAVTFDPEGLDPSTLLRVGTSGVGIAPAEIRTQRSGRELLFTYRGLQIGDHRFELPASAVVDGSGNRADHGNFVTSFEVADRTPTTASWIGGPGANWNDPDSWSDGRVPDATDHVLIDAVDGSVVTLPDRLELRSLTIQSPAFVSGGSRGPSLFLSETLYLESSLRTNGTAFGLHAERVEGNGTIDLGGFQFLRLHAAEAAGNLVVDGQLSIEQNLRLEDATLQIKLGVDLKDAVLVSGSGTISSSSATGGQPGSLLLRMESDARVQPGITLTTDGRLRVSGQASSVLDGALVKTGGGGVNFIEGIRFGGTARLLAERTRLQFIGVELAEAIRLEQPDPSESVGGFVFIRIPMDLGGRVVDLGDSQANLVFDGIAVSNGGFDGGDGVRFTVADSRIFPRTTLEDVLIQGRRYETFRASHAPGETEAL